MEGRETYPPFFLRVSEGLFHYADGIFLSFVMIMASCGGDDDSSSTLS